MKALVVSDCATAEYVQGLSALFPDATVKGASLIVASRWLRGHEKPEFTDYLAETELLVALPSLMISDIVSNVLPGQAHRILIPPLHFWGLHPDCFQLRIAHEPPLYSGDLFSRLIAYGFVVGLCVEETVGLFNDNTYRALGDHQHFDREVARLTRTFAEHRIDLDGAVDRWLGDGNFLFTPNHARSRVYFDILKAAVAGQCPSIAGHADLGASSEAFDDTLASSIFWPVYPELARRHGIDETFEWRSGANTGRVFSLRGYVERCFHCLRTATDLPQAAIPRFEEIRGALEGLRPTMASGRLP